MKWQVRYIRNRMLVFLETMSCDSSENFYGKSNRIKYFIKGTILKLIRKRWVKEEARQNCNRQHFFVWIGIINDTGWLHLFSLQSTIDSKLNYDFDWKLCLKKKGRTFHQIYESRIVWLSNLNDHFKWFTLNACFFIGYLRQFNLDP